MKLRRLMFVLLLFCLMPLQAFASEQEVPQEVFCERIPTQVNPLYQDVYTEADSTEADIPVINSDEGYGIAAQVQPTVNAGEASYVSADAAAVQLRNYMVSRTESFDLFIASDNSDYETLINEVLDAAVSHTGNPKEGDYLLWQIETWGGTVYEEYANGQYNYRYELQMTYYTTAEQEAELDGAIAQLVSSLNVSDKSDYEKVRAVYDYICANITYDYTNLDDDSYTLKYTAYAALMNKTAVCQGYSTLLYRLLLELGVDNRTIAGETVDGDHCWNIVKLGNVYYNLDVTWDAGTGERTYFLQNSDGFLDHFRYLYYDTTQFHTDYPMSATDYVDGVAGEPEYVYVEGTCGDNASWTLNRDGILTISGTGATVDILAGYAPTWYYWLDSIDAVVIEEGITRIGVYTFRGIDRLESITLPGSLKEIGDYAFFDCPSLTEIRFLGNAPTFGSFAFNDVSATVYYPCSDSTWTENVRQQYGSTDITWVSYGHNYVPVITEPTCVKDGYTTHTCSLCQDTYTDGFKAATGQHTYQDAQDTTCDVCGHIRDLNMETTPMFRLYNPNSGEHFYTGSVVERDNLISAGWIYEGIAWNAPISKGSPVYRLYNPNSGDHHYTMSQEEMNNLVAVGWRYEGVAWNSAPPEGNVPQYRLYNPNADCGSHHYTSSVEERDYLVSLGWIFEGIGWYGTLR